MWKKIKNKATAVEMRLKSAFRIKRLIRSGLNRYKWAISSDYRRELVRQRKASRTYQYAEPFRGCGRVLLICEATIPQCFKYRVKQRQEALALIGIASTCLPWQEQNACLDALQSHSAVILYRTPLFYSVSEILREARRLGLSITWEVDDYIFEKSILKNTLSLQDLNRPTFRGILKGARLYKNALLEADTAIASTEALADAMRFTSGKPVCVIHNGIDAETLQLATAVEAQKSQSKTTKGENNACIIGYGSGTNTHNIDFLEAAEGLQQLLEERPYLVFRIIGELQIPATYQHLSRQIERIPTRTYADYLAVLSECHISLAPLAEGVFNDCKSNIKWLEAAALGIPSVCSPRKEFNDAIINGSTGFLCQNSMEWKNALTTLVDDPELRQRIGAKAREAAMAQYGIVNLAKQEVKLWYDETVDLGGNQSHRKPSRLLSLNVYYPPQAFGGATLVAHHLNKWLCTNGGVETAVFCLVPDEAASGKKLHRYSVDNIHVFGVPIGHSQSAEKSQPEASAPNVLARFEEVLDGFDPTVLHVHCIQGIGLDVVEIAHKRGIPYIITLHDAWWLCALQFMVAPSGRYCEQSRIEEAVCSDCTGQSEYVHERMLRMRAALESAESLLAPSTFFVKLFEDNGFRNVRLNRNGVVTHSHPSVSKSYGEAEARVADSAVRYGYLGGNIKIKGFLEIKKVFQRLHKNNDVELILVDNTVNLGHASYFASDIVGLGNVRIMPAFQQDGIDEFYNQIDVLLFPTQWKESFGLAIREALDRGIWVICTDSGGTIEDICDGVNGRIIRFGDDGSELERAVLEAEQIIKTWRLNRESRPTTRVRSCEEQALELLEILRRIGEE